MKIVPVLEIDLSDLEPFYSSIDMWSREARERHAVFVGNPDQCHVRIRLGNYAAEWIPPLVADLATYALSVTVSAPYPAQAQEAARELEAAIDRYRERGAA